MLYNSSEAQRADKLRTLRSTESESSWRKGPQRWTLRSEGELAQWAAEVHIMVRKLWHAITNDKRTHGPTDKTEHSCSYLILTTRHFIEMLQQCLIQMRSLSSIRLIWSNNYGTEPQATNERTGLLTKVSTRVPT